MCFNGSKRQTAKSVDSRFRAEDLLLVVRQEVIETSANGELFWLDIVAVALSLRTKYRIFGVFGRGVVEIWL